MKIGTGKDEGFLWGAATSAHQIDGNNVHSDWWAWEQAGNIDGGATSGLATDHWNRCADDIRLAADLGLNTYRFSVEWARLEPERGKWDHNALDWYRALLAECERWRLMPMLTLHHFTSPQWFALDGGFTQDIAPELFLRYVQFVCSELGARVPLWCTFNEPMVLAVGGFLGRFMPPALYAPDSAALVIRNLLESHVLAYDHLRATLQQDRSGPWQGVPLQVGFAHNMIDFYADRKFSLPDQVLRWMIDRFYNQAWLDAVSGARQNFWIPGLIPALSPVKEALNRRTADFIGVNYYTKAYVRWWPKNKSDQSLPEALMGMTFARLNEQVTDSGWAIHPEGFHRILRRVNKYNFPIIVTENGIADRKDALRPSYLREHLRVLAEAIEEGIDIRGYYHWSLLDNFEWVKGFGPRFGLYYVDYSNFSRVATKSASLYRKLIHSSQCGPPTKESVNKINFD